eukprot:9821-Heterococcus_DN1.PRE.2
MAWLIAVVLVLFLNTAQAASISAQQAPLSPAIASYLQKRQQHADAVAPDYANRPMCRRCKRSEHVCVCAALPPAPVHTATKVIILQHPAEARRRITSTVPLIGLCLQNCDTIISNDFDLNHPVLQAAFSPTATSGEVGNAPLVLYPSDEATFIEDMTPCSLSALESTSNAVGVATVQQEPYIIIIIDGTWSQAKQMIHNIDWLHTHCKPVKFRSGGSSSYTIRREPMPHCLR